jgi:hypothetical protein
MKPPLIVDAAGIGPATILTAVNRLVGIFWPGGFRIAGLIPAMYKIGLTQPIL